MAKQKVKIPDLKREDLKVNRVYRSKKPRTVGFFREVDDRQIIYISEFKSLIETINHGFTEEFKEWCNAPGEYRRLNSLDDQDKYEEETKKPCCNLEQVWDYIVQYDSPSIARGKNYPKIPATKFIKWAEKDVTEIMPKGEWATTL